MEYKQTLNLPKTGFPMKAGLVAREPERLQRWRDAGIYDKIQARRAGAESKFILHDGPPFANGDVHVGTALNKILKDIIVKYKTLRGFDTPYVPGWDCHGLPIEFKVVQELRKKGATDADAATIRTACEEYARKFIDIQREQFKRLGVFGDWDNPYLTLHKEYEADELRLFADIVEKDFVYRGKKPVYWSIPCHTALAEAEVEYQDHVSQSVFVKFPVVGEQNMSLLIWTTTPWTLPANLAVAYNSTFDYTMVLAEGEVYIVSVMLLDKVADICGWGGFEIMRTVHPEEFAEFEYCHPFCDRTGKLFPGDSFVTNDTGTGFVHIAPGHGADDYHLGLANGLPVYSPVDDNGRLAHTADLPVEQQMPAELVGKAILEKKGKSEANEAVIETLRTKDALVHQEDYPHSYPHCWRSKTPVIFRAMDQWFIRIDHDKFRDRAIETIKQVKWVPDWGVNRIESAVKTRPDWCISRQRAWGVPIPAFYDEQNEPVLDARVVRKTADLVEKHGSNVWFERSAEELWAEVKPDDWTGPDPVKKATDTLDVWIDSGSSSRAVLMKREELQHASGENPWQADVYLEGSDQHRGWFQSSLLLSLMGNDAPPYKTVLTHGFMVDEDKLKISKSKQAQGGSYEKPQTADRYIKERGADIIRLWVASQDYRSDIMVSEARINTVGETYRLIRNSLRYQLSNLYDFDPAEHSIGALQMTGLDRWMLAAFSQLQKDVAAAYDAYEFHVVYQRISQFTSVELSSIYHDVIKDRLYTDPANSHRRRSSQTALHQLASNLCHMLAPILVFTADEAWGFLPGVEEGDCVHATDWESFPFALSKDEKAAWDQLFALRELALPPLEALRQAKTIGKGLDAKITLSGKVEALQAAKAQTEDLRELLNVSCVEFNETDADEITAEASRADGEKCERCWRLEPTVGTNESHAGLCGRCVEAVESWVASNPEAE